MKRSVENNTIIHLRIILKDQIKQEFYIYFKMNKEKYKIVKNYYEF
jgi:hypothetical protein